MKKTSILATCILLSTCGLVLNSHAQKYPPQCTGQNLKVTKGQDDADMGGKRYGSFIFENVSGRPCSMRGFAKFAALNARGRVMRSVGIEYTNDYPNGDQDAGKKPQRITIAAGDKAWFQIYYNDGMALDHKKPFPKVSRVRITAPGTTRSFVLRSRFTTCCGIQVGSVRAGVPGSN
jgi:Protein of unknown function (DUF4232)